jgi:hypothetical protein
MQKRHHDSRRDRQELSATVCVLVKRTLVGQPVEAKRADA